VQAIHARAYALCHAPGSAARCDVGVTFPVLWGIWLFHKVRSDLRRARQMCDELLAVAGDDSSRLLQAHQALCNTNLCLGNPQRAVEQMERAEAIYDPALHAGNTQLFGQDPGVATLAFGAVALLLVGRQHDAIAASDRAIRLARRLHQPSSLALALHFAAMLHQLRDDPQTAARCAGESIDIAIEEGFSFWRAGGMILRGWARVAFAGSDSDAQAALEEIRNGLQAWLDTGSRTYQAYFLGVYAEALQRTDRWDDAIAPLQQAIVCAQSLPEGLYEAQLHRLLGRSLQRSGDPDAPAKREFMAAQSIARNHGARLFEQQASAELASLQPSVQKRQRQRLVVSYAPL
jgi:tetratricopeptide (TPR) repeat protein